MEKLFINFEDSKKLKELGFNEDCLFCYRGGSLYSSGGISRYYDDGNWLFENNTGLEGDDWIAAPIYTQAVEWLENKYGIFITVKKSRKNGLNCFMPFINNDSVHDDAFMNDFDSADEAYKSAIHKCIRFSK